MNPLKTVDEYMFFKSCLEQLKQNNIDIFNHWLASLSDKQKERLKILLDTKRITVHSGKLTTDVPRVIKTIKRGNNNSNAPNP
jgi:hypothetical protein